MPKNSLRFFKKGVVFLFIFFLPTQLGKHFFFNFSYLNGVKTDYLAPTIYVSDLLFLGLMAVCWKDIARQVKTHYFLPSLVGILLILQSLFTIYPWLALYYVVKIIQLYLVFQAARGLDNRLALHGLFWAGLLEFILTTAQLYTRGSLQGVFYFLGERYLTLSHPDVARASLWGREFLRPYGTFSHPNSLAGFYLLVYFYALTNNRFRQSFKLYTLATFVFTTLVFISFSKTAIVVYLVLNLFYALRHMKIKCRICLAARAVTLLAVSVIFLSALGDPLSLAKRLTLLGDSFKIIKSNWFWGVGLGHYLIHQVKFASPYRYFFREPVHNAFLLFFAQSGLALGGLLVFGLWRSCKPYVKKTAFIFCFLAAAAAGLADHYWLTLQQNWLILGVVFGLLTKR